MGNFPKLPLGTELTVGSHKVTVVEYLSEGGFAHIYKVHIDPHENGSQIACLKRVIVPDKNGLNQLRKEVDVMKILKDARNIVKYYDSHAERLDDGTYQVLVLMELCPNKSLLDYMNAKIKTKLTESEILTIMYDISLGIYEMHRLHMIHRDIKIENVLIGSTNRFTLCDFGSTTSPIPPPKDQHQFQLLSHDILYQTTPQYRSPEMIDLYRGFPIDEKSDIWALGCFLYKLCYYTTPFEANGDIAILHASFQFLPAPSYSGDLKNLIIIMLQENPLFRPNIVQVIMLLAKMMEIDFKDVGIDDFYKTGGYNFQALHEYQRQKQKEMIKQQQLFYQQQQLAASQARVSPTQPSSHIPGTIAPQASAPSEERPKDTQAQPSRTASESKRSSKAYETNEPSQDLEVGAESEKDTEELEDEVSFGDLENLDNVEERYPSLEDILDDSHKHSQPIASAPPTLSPKLVKSVPLNSEPPTVSPQQVKSIPLYAPPTKPVVLNADEVRKLTKEQLKQYNYQHQVYKYQLQQYQFHAQQQHNQFQQQQLPVKDHRQYVQPPQAQQVQPRKNFNPYQDGTEYEKKEAWERRQVHMNKSAEKLVDDIFAESPVTGAKSSLSAKSDGSHQEISRQNSSVERANNRLQAEIQPREKKSFEEPRSSEVNEEPRNNEGAPMKPFERERENNVPVPDGSLELPRFDGESKKEPVFPDLLDFESVSRVESHPVEKEPDVGIVPQQLDVKPPHLTENSQVKYATASVVPTLSTSVGSSNALGLGGNPFPFKQPKPINKVLDDSGKDCVNVEQRSSANPWREFRTSSSSTSIPITKVQSLPGSSYTQEPNHKESPEILTTMTKNPREELVEPNLIDLEVGLESSNSSSATPVLQPKTNNKEIYSLGSDLSLLDLDVKESKPQTPQFKKRISSALNPSQFSFQEEVIDFASDDENPENGSRMNRLSIRNSLKKPKSRKSSDNKKNESSNEPKKRLSFFGGTRSELT
ncbi:uncharacterized protein CANTADRAFT_45149 [Suhomyces tanzawaensis NRRL Y-17324]|uniref:Protein kinase domain-containing protein n=1 Tax=Suhomyces tanzawaensis NRRL Y-17324 TaxID=984487 RepID=A0A1E4SSJ0_9ASCO|nr:uncharacterized protein CANTADRAFT_45149 [Suhomyces tanzawaensis NRRL Y-17324]ODV82465.1 hypothetical protein CANTADRAFT_45149 [Suhomyces tanzawaensis NRRL Y-17324]